MRLEQVTATVAVLVDPAGHEAPWTSTEIPAAMPVIAEQAQGGALAAAAATTRWLARLEALGEIGEMISTE
ncbi:hypothetical protein [Streptomyces avicenniae]|uniref:hypothetical protein n=1 Tax=Streptomyces avicenniae TaxID=500153 RepID=UPI00167C4B63|nr:hypothetical protein [Streptomyces avicenniae]